MGRGPAVEKYCSRYASPIVSLYIVTGTQMNEDSLRFRTVLILMIHHHAYSHLLETPLLIIPQYSCTVFVETKLAVQLTSRLQSVGRQVKEYCNRHYPPRWFVVLIHNLVLPGHQILLPLNTYSGGGT